MAHNHPIDVGQLVLLHDPNDRPGTWRSSSEKRTGYHWSVWKRVVSDSRFDAHYEIVVGWQGKFVAENDVRVSSNLDDGKFIVIETSQPLLDAYVMAAIHMKPGQWHTMLDRKYPWDEIDQHYGDNWRAYRR